MSRLVDAHREEFGVEPSVGCGRPRRVAERDKRRLTSQSRRFCYNFAVGFRDLSGGSKRVLGVEGRRAVVPETSKRVEIDMRSIRFVVALAAIACMVGVGAASSYASQFESRFTEKLAGKQIGTEEFVVYPMTVSCNKATSAGSTPIGLKPSFEVTTTYSVCTTLAGALKATVSPAVWEYQAEKEGNGKPEGTIALLNEVTIKPTIGTGCKYTIPPQGPIATDTVLYEDGYLAPTGTWGRFKTEGQEKLSAYTKFTGLQYLAIGWPCTGPKSAEELKEQKAEESSSEGGKFVGATKLEVVSGDLTWIYP